MFIGYTNCIDASTRLFKRMQVYVFVYIIMFNVIVYECLYMYHYHTYALSEELFM